MTYVPDRPACLDGQYLASPVELSLRWLADLRTSLDALAAQPTERAFWGPRADRCGDLLAAVFGGRPLPADVEPRWGSTEHLDLHWGNVTVPNLMILDWEHWGQSIAGFGAARLYCTALAVPTVAGQIFDLFSDVLTSPSGRYATLINIADLIRVFAFLPDEIGLRPALHQAATEILG